MGVSYPPSNGAFSENDSVIGSIVSIFLVNVYPYFTYVNDPKNVHLDYALGTGKGTVVTDGANQYYMLFDSRVDGI
ncbi:glucan endo-1 [Quercus suber]|uniref:glucan endo-1,3-beta-D-glucosidase n=1 Tax=Quercus suber TaxID=58331 RepID=A0AAW0ME53_QUESU